MRLVLAKARQAMQRRQVLPTFEFMTLTGGDVRSLRRPANDDWVPRFEDQFRAKLDAPHASAFGAGRFALSALLEAFQIGKGDQVIVPAYTCVVVPNAVQFAGAEVAWCDVELETFGNEVASVEAAVTAKTRAILLQHTYGIPARDAEAIRDLAEDKGILVIEDCAHATGARVHGRRVGADADAAFYSFERSKVITTVQGGMAVTIHDDVAERLQLAQANAPGLGPAAVRRLADVAAWGYYRYRHPLRRWTKSRQAKRLEGAVYHTTTPAELAGRKPPRYGHAMPPELARLGVRQLARLDGLNERRRTNARQWEAWVKEQGMAGPRPAPGAEPTYLRYPFLATPEQKNRPGWVHQELGIHAGTWFASNLHPSDTRIPNQPNAAAAVDRCLNLPGLI